MITDFKNGEIYQPAFDKSGESDIAIVQISNSDKFITLAVYTTGYVVVPKDTKETPLVATKDELLSILNKYKATLIGKLEFNKSVVQQSSQDLSNANG